MRDQSKDAKSINHHPEFTRGMQRALEIAEAIGMKRGYERAVALIPICELKEAVEKELEPR